MNPTRLLLLDDHTLFRESLARLLESEREFEIMGRYGNVSEALDALRALQVDVVLLDYDLGEHKGNAFLAAARELGYSDRVLIVTAGVSEGEVAFALQHGVSGVFLKHESPTTLVQAIRLVAAGGVWFSPELLQNVANQTSQNSESSETIRLSPREQRVLDGVFEGLSNKEIGAQLAVSEGTVKATLQHLFEKCKVRTRSQLVRVALQRSLSTKERS